MKDMLVGPNRKVRISKVMELVIKIRLRNKKKGLKLMMGWTSLKEKI